MVRLVYRYLPIPIFRIHGVEHVRLAHGVHEIIHSRMGICVPEFYCVESSVVNTETPVPVGLRSEYDGRFPFTLGRLYYGLVPHLLYFLLNLMTYILYGSAWSTHERPVVRRDVNMGFCRINLAESVFPHGVVLRCHFLCLGAFLVLKTDEIKFIDRCLNRWFCAFVGIRFV